MEAPTSTFTQAETITFFTDVLMVNDAARLRLADEGINSVASLFHYDNDMLEQVIRNLRKPNGDDVAPDGAIVPVLPVAVSALTVDRLKKFSKAVRWFGDVSRSISPESLTVSVALILDKALDSLKDKRKNDKSVVPKYDPKTMSLLLHHDLMIEFFAKKVGTRGYPLAYVLRSDSLPDLVPSPLLANRPYSEENGSVANESVVRASHDHPLFSDDNAEVQEFLEEAYVGTHVHPTLKSFSRRKDGRSSWLAILEQFMSEERWREELKRQETITTTRRWKGNSNYSLEKHGAVHRNAKITHYNASLGPVKGSQVPEERKFCERFIDSIYCNDPTLLAALANVRKDDGPEGMMNNFEKMLAYLIPCCPVAKNRKNSPNNNIQAQVSAFELKKGKGKTGVDFRFYSDKEYQELTPAQRKELKEHRDSQGKRNSGKTYSEQKRLRKNESFNKKRKFGKKRRTDKEDFKKKIKGIISETVSTIIEDKKEERKESPRKGSVGSVSITKNNILRKGSISTINMRRIFYHMLPKKSNDTSHTNNECISISSGSNETNTCPLSHTCLDSSRNDRLMELNEEMLPSHRYTHMLGEHMEDSISPSVPFLEISSLNTYNDISRTELDSHANMVVLGQNCRLEEPTAPRPGEPGSRYAIVAAFSPEHKPMRVQVVDACVGYWCPINETTYILHFNDVLYVPSMDHNLIPPFVLREAGFIVNDVPRIHCHEVSRESHSIISEDGDLRIPLRLHGVFSYFPTFRPDCEHYHTGSSNEHYLMTPTGSDWNPNTTTYSEAENYYIDENGEIMPTRMSSAKEFKNDLLQSQAVNIRNGLYEEEETLHIPEGYEVEISAINKLYTVAPADLVPETGNWKLAIPSVISSSNQSTPIEELNTSSESEWEILTPPSQSSFTNNIVAREAMGQMAMAIGSTSSWDDQCLFPDINDDINDNILGESINRWSERKICSSVASIHARLPCQEDDDNSYMLDDNSYDMLDDKSICIKQESDCDDYSVYSDDERKLPAKPFQVPVTMGIKQEDEPSEEETVHIPARLSQVPATIGIKQEDEASDEEMEHSICEHKDVSSDQSMPTACSKSSVTQPTRVKEEGELRLGKRRNSSKKKKPQARRRLTYDEVSYFDGHTNRDHDDEDPSSMDPSGKHRLPRGRNETRTRNHYHVRTRLSKRRTRSSYRTKRRSIDDRPIRTKGWTKHEHLNRRHNNYDLSVSGSDFAKERVNRIVSGTTMQSGVTTTFNIDRLMKAWRIDKETALNTIRATTQRYKRKHDPKMTRNSSTKDKATRYNRIKDHLFMDTMFVTGKSGRSIRGNTCAQVFTTDRGFLAVYPLRSKAQVKQAIRSFCKEIGVPSAFIGDQSGEQTSIDVQQYIKSVGSTLRLLEEGTPWANRAELVIGHLKAAVRKDLMESNCPLCLWDYCIERRVRINNLTAKNIFALKGETPYTTVYGIEGDISALSDFAWYEPIYYLDHKQPFPYAKEVLGRYLGPSFGVGNEYCSWILKPNGKVIARRTLRSLTHIEQSSPVEIKKLQHFDYLITEKFGDGISGPKDFNISEEDRSLDFDNYYQSDSDSERMTKAPRDADGNAINQQPVYDKLIDMDVRLAHNDEITRAKVTGRTIFDNGQSSGTYDENPYRNTLTYDVMFPDGTIKEYAASLLAENMVNQIDKDSFEYNLLECILNHRKKRSVLASEDERLKTSNGNPILHDDEWFFQILWHDGNKEWIPLKEIKESNPIELAEYLRSERLHKEPIFKHWIPTVLQQREAIVSKVKARAVTTHKYGVEIPRSVPQAHRLDERNGNSIWRKAIEKEMTNVGIAFQLLSHGEDAPVGYTKASGHLIFDVKMDFTRKARFVLDGHKTEKPEISTYAGVVSRESIRIALTYASLNKLQVYAADIQNAYLQAPSSQKHYIDCGPEFGKENIGRKALIHRALYGGKTAGRDFRNHLRECMKHIHFKSCLADPDVWMRAAMDDDGKDYYEYVLLWTDDCLVISHRPEFVLRNEIGKYFKLKEESIGPPKIYLGGKMRQVQLENSNHAWSFSSAQYVKNAVKNVEEKIVKDGRKLVKRATTPFLFNYRPEVDGSPELNAEDASYYQSLIGILRWIVELGRVDICCEVSMMSTQLALPREGHYEAVLHIFSYLKSHHNTEMVFDPSDPMVDITEFQEKDWSTSVFGSELKEIIPSNIPEPRGQGMLTRCFVDADHASDTVTRRSRTGFIVYVNMAPVFWFSKKQTTVETSSFGSEFVAMKNCTEYIRGLRYRLRMMGIQVLGPTYIYGDNQSVLYNTTIPESTLKKKSQSLCYHFVREGVARNEWRTGYIQSVNNPADILTKPLPATKRQHLVKSILHHIYDDDDALKRVE